MRRARRLCHSGFVAHVHSGSQLPPPSSRTGRCTRLASPGLPPSTSLRRLMESHSQIDDFKTRRMRSAAGRHARVSVMRSGRAAADLVLPGTGGFAGSRTRSASSPAHRGYACQRHDHQRRAGEPASSRLMVLPARSAADNPAAASLGSRRTCPRRGLPTGALADGSCEYGLCGLPGVRGPLPAASPVLVRQELCPVRR